MWEDSAPNISTKTSGKVVSKVPDEESLLIPLQKLQKFWESSLLRPFWCYEGLHEIQVYYNPTEQFFFFFFNCIKVYKVSRMLKSIFFQTTESTQIDSLFLLRLVTCVSTMEATKRWKIFFEDPGRNHFVPATWFLQLSWFAKAFLHPGIHPA